MDSAPLVVIGAGPIGLAAATHAAERGLEVTVLEAGSCAGAAVREWGHVRLFSPWSELIDPAAERALAGTAWNRPDPRSYPTGRDWAEQYLQPLADALSATGRVTMRYGSRVVGVSRWGRDRVVDADRDRQPFSVQVATGAGGERVVGSAVIDASGTWGGPNPLGGDGLPALGEAQAADRIGYRVPDLRDPADRGRYAGRHIVVAGSGASAQNTLVELAALATDAPDTRVTWLVRRATTGDAFGGGDNDQLVARGALGTRARQAAQSGVVTTLTGFRARDIDRADNGTLTITSLDGQVVTGADEVIAVTGFRPDLSMVNEVRLDLDPVLQAPTALAPLIDPNVHSCGTVYPHGAHELGQPEVGFYLAGMKSYGRAPSFLALTGYEQVRSIVAELAGDHEAASRVELVLPETGVCGGSGLYDQEAESAGGCCGTPAAQEVLTIGTAPAR